MTTNSTYEAFITYVKQTTALQRAAGVLSWDQEVMMPPKGANARAEQMGALESALHERRTNRQLGEWLQELENCNLDETQRRNVDLARRSYDRATKVPARLAEELARTTARSQGIWAQARADNSFEDFAPTLTKVIALRREEAAAIAQSGQSHYDALLNDYEPGMTTATLSPLLESMRPRLSALRAAIAESGVEQPRLKGMFPAQVQMTLARSLADNLGYDWDAGRLDLSTHPFSSGSSGDARITTRVDEAEPYGCLYSTVHELGHALYEQGMPPEHEATPIGHYVSMGVHESQSRLWENQIARSRAYIEWFYPAFRDAFPDCGIDSPDDLYRSVNHVETGFIRTEADEVHYNLHVLLRFELERDLIEDNLQVADLEQAWNERFKRDFGIAVPDATRGVLQDVHWSVGLFGYFPTYSLGNIYAGQLNLKLRDDVSNLDEKIKAGETGDALAWLRKHIHNQGSLYEPGELIRRACGSAVSIDPLLNYLEAKYGELFNL